DSNKHIRLTLLTRQRELSSSPQAVAATLRKMVNDRAPGGQARDELRHFLELAESIPIGRKLRAVQEILQNVHGKFLILTEYRGTLEAITHHLAKWGISAVGFHGGLDIRQKEAAVQRFRGELEDPED